MQFSYLSTLIVSSSFLSTYPQLGAMYTTDEDDDREGSSATTTTTTTGTASSSSSTTSLSRRVQRCSKAATEANEKDYSISISNPLLLCHDKTYFEAELAALAAYDHDEEEMTNTNRGMYTPSPTSSSTLTTSVSKLDAFYMPLSSRRQTLSSRQKRINFSLKNPWITWNA